MARLVPRSLLPNLAKVRPAGHRLSRAANMNKHGGGHGFASSAPRCLVAMTGFSDEQLTVRRAVAALCSRSPSTYWQERGKAVHSDPRKFHAALAKDGSNRRQLS
ncbi:hypothetical protein B0T26DRAFT_751031 [Lasiosphaeria miniovina]|uniref:Uncharacterized protein n=1 Tax=Lasiosphaeria miniovina TaxID=1954250 RepID=A0AA40DXQ0_9PEZI|nr:uncharacterized protein B0T26DRAFT_751031 [Lasiosphaeria miniovina]KAK0716886.1 hypothetical protein B0T26DRAFT_751031 [Lasiosphaeria miniovina]